MASQTLHLPFVGELVFHDGDNQPLPVQTIELSVDTLNDSIIRCFLAFKISYAAYETVDSKELFNLLPDSRGEIFGGKLDTTVDVEIEAKLDPGFIFDIAMSIHSLEELAAHLRDLNQNQPESDLLASESWYALNVKQSVPLPPEFGAGSLKVGYKTTWGDY
jgi:hypothetical protein